MEGIFRRERIFISRGAPDFRIGNFRFHFHGLFPGKTKVSRVKKRKKKKKKLGEKFARHGRKSGIMVVIGTAECTGIRVSRVDSFFLRIVSKPESFACLPAKKKKKKRGRRKKTPFRDCRGKEGRKGGGYCLEGYVLFIRLFSSSIDVRIFIHE